MGRLLSSRVAASLLLFVSIATSAQAPVQSQTQTETKKSGTGKQPVKSILVQPGVLPAAGTQRPQPGQPSGTPGYSLQPPLTLNPTVTATLLPPETDQKVRVTISWAQPGVDAEKCIIKWGDQTASDACGQDYTDHTYAAPKTYLIQVVASGYVNDRPFTSIGRTVIRIAVPPPSDAGTVQPEPSPTTQANPEPTPTLEGTPEPSQGSKGKPKPPPNVKGKPEKPPGQYPVLTLDPRPPQPYPNFHHLDGRDRAAGEDAVGDQDHGLLRYCYQREAQPRVTMRVAKSLGRISPGLVWKIHLLP